MTGIMGFQELRQGAVRPGIDFQNLRTKTPVVEMSYLDSGLEIYPWIEFEPHLKLLPYLKVIVTDQKYAFSADVLNQACKTVFFVSQLSSPVYLETARTNYFRRTHTMSGSVNVTTGVGTVLTECRKLRCRPLSAEKITPIC